MPRDGHGRWSHTDLLIATVIDLLKWQLYATYAVHGGKPKQPEPLARPGVKATRTRRGTSPAAKAALRAIAEEHARLHGYSLDEQQPAEGT
jgi:hypothetical protein